MAKVLYTANAHVTGGRDGHGRTTDGELEVDLRVPKEMGGAGGGTNPEQLFAVGDAACFYRLAQSLRCRPHQLRPGPGGDLHEQPRARGQNQCPRRHLD